MALSRITAGSIADGTVVAADIADGSITTAKIADANVTSDKISSATITGDKIATSQITANLFATDAVTGISDGTSNVSVTSTNGNVIIGTAGSERVRVTTEGNVGIGTSLPVAYSGYGNLAIDGTNGAFLQFHRGGTDEMEVYIDGTNNNIRGKTSKPMLFYTADTERMRIDSSGRVTMPYQPCFFARVNGNASNSLSGYIIYDAAVFNVGSHYNTSNGIFTAPVAGKYMFSIQFLPPGNASVDIDNPLRITFHKNNSSYPLGSNQSQMRHTVSAHSGFLSMIIDLSANDTVRVNVFNKNIDDDPSYQTFSGFLIG